MKHLFLGVALLLAAAAAAQTRTEGIPVMRMSNPSQYLEIKFGTGPSARPAPAEQPTPPKFNTEEPSAGEKSLQAEYRLHLAALEACSPDVYLEELEYMYRYKGEKPLTEEQLGYLIWTQRSREYASEK